MFYTLNLYGWFGYVFCPQYGTTPLIWAARKGHYDCVMHLLENGADVDQEGAVSAPLPLRILCLDFNIFVSFETYLLSI